jgi:hypothetical protein
MENESCISCKFWKDCDGLLRKGNCRRYPPQVIHKIDMAECPVVSATFWCGEWQGKEER